jgi:hypothetical protein
MPKIQSMSIVLGAVLGFSISSFLQMLWVPHHSGFDRKLSMMSQQVPLDEKAAIPGWREVHVYVGDGCKNGSTVFNRTREFPSQLGQDRKVIELFRAKPNGYYIDLAANDAHALSNTFALEKYHNWTGLCIEPNDHYWKSLIYARKCTIVGALVADTVNAEVPVAFRGFSGGIVSEETDNKQGGTDFRKTTSFSQILDKFDVPKVIDYLSLDVEGAEEMVMSSFPFDEYTISVLTVERPTVALKHKLRDNGYWNKMQWDELFFHKSFDDIQTMYPKGDLDPDNVEWYEEYKRKQTQLSL